MFTELPEDSDARVSSASSFSCHEATHLEGPGSAHGVTVALNTVTTFTLLSNERPPPPPQKGGVASSLGA